MSIKSVFENIIRKLTRNEKAIEDVKRQVIVAPFMAGKASLQTIAAGVIAVTRPHVVVLPESGTADNLDTINNFTDGKFIVLSTADVSDTITVRDESISGGNIALRGVTSKVLSDPEDSILLIYKESVGFWIQTGVTAGSGGTPDAHAASHQHGGTDEVATATPAANAIPKALGTGLLASGWIPATAPAAHATTHKHGGSDEVATATPGANAIPKAGAGGKLADGWLDATLASIAALGTVADRIAYTTGVDVWAETPLTAFVRTILDDANQAAVQATLALVPGTNVQAQDAELQAIAGLTSAADRLPYFTGLGTASLATFTAFARTFLDDANQAAVQATLALVPGTNVQAFDATLATIAALNPTTDQAIYYTGTNVAATYSLTSYGRTLAALADAAAGRTALGLIAGGAGDIWVEKAGDTMAGALDFANTYFVTNLPNPSSAQHAATKAYVDALFTGLDFKGSVRAATTADITLSGAQTIDGISVIAGDRVLVKNQSTGANNGIYVAAVGAWARSADADTSAEVTSGMWVLVEEGTANDNTAWILTTNNPITLGSTTLVFSPFLSSMVVDGSGLSFSGNILNINVDGSTLEIVADALKIKDAELLAIAGLVSAADKLPYFTGSGTASLADLSTYARTLIDDIDQTTARATLGLGTIAVEPEANYLLLGGRAGGQSAHGGNAANEDLTLRGTSHATKTSSYILMQPDGGFVGIGPVPSGAPVNMLFVEETGIDLTPAAFGLNATSTNPPRGNNLLNRDQSANSFHGYRADFTTNAGGNARGIALVAGKEQLYTSSAATQDAYAAIMVALNNVLTERVRWTSAGLMGVGQTVPVARVSVLESTLGAIVQRLESEATNDNPIQDFFQWRIATTNVSPTAIFTLPIPASHVCYLEATILGIRTGGSAGAAGDCAVYAARGVFNNVAGTVTNLANLATVIFESQAGWDVNWDVSGTDGRLRVTGATNNNITWHAHVYHRFGSN